MVVKIQENHLSNQNELCALENLKGNDNSQNHIDNLLTEGKIWINSKNVDLKGRCDVLLEILNDIDKSEESKTPEQITQIRQLRKGCVTLFRKLHLQQLNEKFTNEEERQLWSQYLIEQKRQKETAWLKINNEIVDWLVFFSKNGYQPSDIILEQTINKGGGKKKNSAYYQPEPNSPLFSPFVWHHKTLVDNYWALEKVVNQLDLSNNSRWEVKISEIVGEKRGAGQPLKERVEEEIYRRRINLEENNSKELIKEIGDLVLREQSIHYSKTQNGEKWNKDLISDEQLENIFYHPDLKFPQLETCWQLLTNIQSWYSQYF